MRFIRSFAVLVALALPGLAAAAVQMQFAHAAPLSTAIGQTGVIVRINGQDVVTFEYGDQRGYLNLGGTGTYAIELRRVGSNVPLVSATAQLVDGQRYTAIVLGNNQTQPFGLLLAQDFPNAPPAGMANVRIVNAGAFSANVAELDVAIRTSDGTVFAGMADVPYATPSNYAQIAAQTNQLRVTTDDGDTPLAGDTAVTFAGGTNTTLIVAGDGINQPVTLRALVDGAATGAGLVDFSVNGAWTTGNATGQGITLFPIPAERRLIGTWYTYNDNGTLQWYTLDSCRTPVGQTTCAAPAAFDNRRAVLAVYATSGGRFLTTDAIALRVAGTLTIEFQSCSQATASYDVDGRTGTFTMQNLIAPPDCTIP